MNDLNPDRWLEMLEDQAMREPEPLDDGDCEVSDDDDDGDSDSAS